MTMRVARTVAREQLAFVELPRPERAPGEVLVRILAVTLCGTDLHIFEDDYPTELPLVQGHELAGVVVETDPDRADLRGARVVIDPVVACGVCHACRAGRPNVCASLSVLGCYEDGGFAEFVAVPATRVHRVPAGLPTEVAALAEPTSIALQAVTRSRPQPGEIALVLGCGPIGLLAALALADRGVIVLAADTDAVRAATARGFGASETFVVAPGFPDAAQQRTIDELTDHAGPIIVIEATGVPASLQNAVRLVASGGRVVQVGISTRTVELSMTDLPYKELDLLGSRNSLGLIPQGLDLLSRHRGAAEELLTHAFAFDDLADAFAAMADPAVPTGKIVIRMPLAEAVPA
ncbi:MAG: hypothetical protein ABT08_08405 [Microbacterium sp. SCN 71-21]|uniref:alcohol dehydrogenase catalytic domain-containing protein n=1 Tax=Microbacterium sp. SCN 71-21 TaxID=1660116 RepID=UPI00086CE598|nr:alcohol dehydrogenase catalytic domain-containing protein [Microbacterium sp. SCN 71-21]ODU76786.1 MAG: hypothetical protein ABT08_08405 [Microbacterium sp. SCN 71-21]